MTLDEAVSIIRGTPTPDGRPIALPGDSDLLIDVTGARVRELQRVLHGTSSISMWRFILWMEDAAGQLRHEPAAEPVPAGQPGQWLGCGFAARDGTSPHRTLRAITEWAAGSQPVDVYAAAGKWTFLWSPLASEDIQVVVFPELVPPPPAGETGVAHVSILIPPGSGSGSGYLRVWTVSAAGIRGLPVMLSACYGPPAELFTDPDAGESAQLPDLHDDGGPDDGA